MRTTGIFSVIHSSLKTRVFSSSSSLKSETFSLAHNWVRVTASDVLVAAPIIVFTSSTVHKNYCFEHGKADKNVLIYLPIYLFAHINLR